ncbi:sister chromatid cohesion 1 protein 1 [Euphorbia lathyris]|uniref:sister chromatid cohesion 1 protein 1 n=1 Tax=Euphorbia lathyris TaxID=212925 RepID=UPI00331414C4
MFYSHQLLARKAPLGQIWMAATMHAKMNRKNLSKLNIIKICEEILNPSVPMALRLSGILMGGVVIVYERKVKLLYEDVTRLLVEINEAWKVKPAPDRTVLPKGKSQAKKETVTLPENQETADLGDIEQSVNFPNSNATMAFQRTAYFAMRLDDIEEPNINNDPMEEDAAQKLHQADAENIKLYERFDFYQAKLEHNRFERFDIEEDEEPHLNFTSGDHTTDIPSTLIPSPPIQEEAPRADEVQDPPEKQFDQQPDKCKEVKQEQVMQEPVRKKTRRHANTNTEMDYDQIIIPGHIYTSWLKNTSGIVSRSRRKRKAYIHIVYRMKVPNLMELPPLVLLEDLSTRDNQIYYPAPLLDLWMKSTQPPHDSPSVRTNVPLPPEPSSSSPPPPGGHYQDPIGYPFEDFNSGVGSDSLGISIEKLRTNVVNNAIPMEIPVEGVNFGLMDNGKKTTEANIVTFFLFTDDEVRSIPSSGSGHGLPAHHSEVHSARANKKRPHSSSRNSGSSLEPVEEENTWQFPDPDFKLSRLSENDPTTDQEVLLETGPTQTQHPIIGHQLDKITDTMRMQMKAHFDTPGAPSVESLNKLADGMNRKGAAMLFYQTCVLATRDFLKVEQKVPYGDIFIFKGGKL